MSEPVDPFTWELGLPTTADSAALPNDTVSDATQGDYAIRALETCQAENARLREALERIAHPTWSMEDARAMARHARRALDA